MCKIFTINVYFISIFLKYMCNLYTFIKKTSWAYILSGISMNSFCPSVVGLLTYSSVTTHHPHRYTFNQLYLSFTQFRKNLFRCVSLLFHGWPLSSVHSTKFKIPCGSGFWEALHLSQQTPVNLPVSFWTKNKDFFTRVLVTKQVLS